jgi:hypothetical protein
VHAAANFLNPSGFGVAAAIVFGALSMIALAAALAMLLRRVGR